MGQLDLPRQKLSYRQKTAPDYDHTGKSWGEINTDRIIHSMYSNTNTRRASMDEMQKYYDAYNNKIDPADFEYVTKPFELVDKATKQRIAYEFPAKLQPYDAVSTYFKLLIGEDMKRAFSPIVRVVNSDALSEKAEQEKQILLQTVEEILLSAHQPQDPNQPQQSPEQIIKEQLASIKDIREEQATHILKYYRQLLDLEKVWQDGWKDYLLAGEEIYCIEQVAGQPVVRRVNPKEIYFLLPNNSNEIDKSTIICERNKRTTAEIIDEFYDKLTSKQIDLLENMQPQSSYPQVEYAGTLDRIPEVTSINVFSQTLSQGIDVYRCRWASYKEIGIYHSFDENGEPQEQMVDETFIEDKSENSYVDWYWVKEYWQSIRLGNETTGIYLDIQPVRFRFNTTENLSECSSGYVGTICDADNSKSISLMGRVYPWLCNYIIMWYRTELLIAANLGDITQIDTSTIPDDWDISKWMYYAKAMKISFVNSFNESNKTKMMGQTQNQSQLGKTLNADQGDAIQHHINMLQFIEQKIQMTTGITPQRLGAIESSELVGNTERAVVQSSHTTEPYFSTHNQTKVRVLKHLLEVAKDSLSGKSKTVQYVLDDVETMLLTIDGNTLNSAQLGIFITNSSADLEALVKAERLMEAAIQSDKISMSDAIKLYSSKSISAIEKALKQSEINMQQSQQVAEQKQQQHEKDMLDIQREDREDQQAWQSGENQLDREKDIYLAELKAIGQDSMGTETLDTPTIIETGQLALEHLKAAQDNIKHSREMHQKDKELKSKEMIENKKLQQVAIQNKNQIELANKKAKLDKEMMEKKIAIERIKARRKPASSK